MLVITTAVSPTYYARLAQIGYYNDAPEAPGMWYGDGARALGLTGQIANDATFTALFTGYAPDGTPLVRNAGSDTRKNAWDLTFSAPKSFSALWAISDAPLRATLESIEVRAVHAALAVADEYLVTRKGAGGIHREGCAGVYALFPHSTSREGDPQRHVHCLLMNIGVGSDGTTSALETHDLFRMKKTLGALYRAELARLLHEECGFAVERTQGNTIEMVGRNAPLCALWSTRARQITTCMAALGLSSPEEAAFICRETRAPKDETTPLAVHRARWQEEARAFGVTASTLFHVLQTEGERVTMGRSAQSAEEKETLIIDATKARLYREYAHFTQYQLFATVAEESQEYGLSFKAIERLRTIIEQECMALYREKHGVLHYTTPETFALEEAYLRNIRTLAGGTTHPVSPPLRHAMLTTSLSDEQKLAALHVTGAGQLALVEGFAGTGKTTFLREAVRYYSCR